MVRGLWVLSIPKARTPWNAVVRGGGLLGCVIAVSSASVRLGADEPARVAPKVRLTEYYRRLSEPEPIAKLEGEPLRAHQRRIKERLLRVTGLDPPPKRIPLDIHESQVLDHPWCTVRRVAYRIWPRVYATGLLYEPKTGSDERLPAMLCPHGHWAEGNAHPDVQRRCLFFAKLGYVTFSPTQNHYEDLNAGVSHQTVMIWGNMRALDYLESHPRVDPGRIGVAGESGGGLQTQMLVALDPRVRAATVVGLTCDFREIMFIDGCHCACNHFPRVMQFTDHPEISTLGQPAALQFLTMNDWTRTFLENRFPEIQRLYSANSSADRTECVYYDTPHNYDRPKRERTYAWMERWVNGRDLGSESSIAEPETEPFPVDVLTNLIAAAPEDLGFGEIGRIYRRERSYSMPPLDDPETRRTWNDAMAGSLRELLGESQRLPTTARAGNPTTEEAGDLRITRIDLPSEGNLVVPTLFVRDNAPRDRRPVVILCGPQGKDRGLGESGTGSAAERARSGALVVLPDVRFIGELAAITDAGPAQQRNAWQRNGIVWGRPLPGMAATDFRCVIDGLAECPDADSGKIALVVPRSGDLAIGALFAAALDPRIRSIDVDFDGASFANGKLPIVPFVLGHGDVLQWTALLADRQVILRGAPADAAATAWLEGVFAHAGNRDGLRVVAASPSP
ncbi:MAG: hypothetical protein FJ297_16800 [Planctomycetes bacterium]|nr:hypothetical protein [Planctomycetota bacterium]